MIAGVPLKKRMAVAQVFRVVVSKLGYREELGLVILLEVHKGLEIRFHCIVLLLSLTVSLRVESGRKPPFNAKEVAEQ